MTGRVLSLVNCSAATAKDLEDFVGLCREQGLKDCDIPWISRDHKDLWRLYEEFRKENEMKL